MDESDRMSIKTANFSFSGTQMTTFQTCRGKKGIKLEKGKNRSRDDINIKPHM